MKPGDKVKILRGPHKGRKGYLSSVQGPWCCVSAIGVPNDQAFSINAVKVIQRFKLEYWLP